MTFPTHSTEGYTVSMSENYDVQMSIPETDQQFPKNNTYTVFLKFDFCIIKKHSQKFILYCNVCWIDKYKDKQQS